MPTNREVFLSQIGQTSPSPMLLEIERAKGIFMYDTSGKRYFDMVSGFSVSNVGHLHPKVVEAVHKQVDKYMHLTVYGEYIQSPQVQFASLLLEQLSDPLNCIYYVSSGSEAIEGAMKLAKRATGRSEIVAFHHAYHGSTHGALSLMGSRDVSYAYLPLLPDIRHIQFNHLPDLDQITHRTAAVVVEPIQAEAGIILPENDYLKKLRQRCTETGALLIFDEIQTGFGRTGKLFAYMHYGVVPDVLAIAKGMGGGMPIGAFVASSEQMAVLANNPALGHITTFGGHPVSAAAAHAALQVLIDDDLSEQSNAKGQLYLQQLVHPLIKSFRGSGLFWAIELDSAERLDLFMVKSLKNGLVFDRFLFDNTRFRIGVPLTITTDEILESCQLILQSLDECI